MKVLHISAECYPAAKAGGLADVVGALPKYLNRAGVTTGVIIPKYSLKWMQEQQFQTIYRGAVRLHHTYVPFTIEQEVKNTLGFPFFVASIPGKFDRPGIYADPGGYGYGDDVERYLCFTQAVLQWIINTPGRPEVLHCHDHHTGLIPFMVKHCPAYASLADVPTVFTIHNAMYHGAFGWDKLYLLPFFEREARGLLDWRNNISPMAAGVKCAWRVTTVSNSYLAELRSHSNGLEWLFDHERHKSVSILNGIDAQVWDPRTDPYIAQPLTDNLNTFKAANKQALAPRFQIDTNVPLITFIGRLVSEKGADLLPDLTRKVVHSGMKVAFAVLGTGEPWIRDAFRQMNHHLGDRFDAVLGYDEGLAHQLYAGSDFLLIPSRVEPCGLNQMYAMRYGAIPIARRTGGLQDTIIDIGEPGSDGRGILFHNFDLDDAFQAVYRATDLYHNRPLLFDTIRERISQLDFSWEKATGHYLELYQQLTI